MSRKVRTLAVTCLARSFSSFEPAATLCLRRFAIVVLACFTAAVPGPSFASGCFGASGAAQVTGAGAIRQGTAEDRTRAMANRRSIGLLWTTRPGAEFTRRPAQAYHGDVPLEDRLCPP